MHLFTFTSLASTFIYAFLYDWRLLSIQLTIISLYYLGARLRSRGKTTTRNKIQMGTWGAPQDTSAYGTIEVDCGIIDDFIEKYNQKNPDARISYTHFFMKLIGMSIAKAPRINGTIAFGEFVPFEGVNVNTLVDIDGKNLAGVTVQNCDSLSLSEIRTKTNSKVKALKTKKDENVKEQMKIAKMLPSSIMACLLEISTFITYNLGLDFKALRLKKYQFGNVVITNVTKMGINHVFAPLVNFTRSICIVVLCSPEDRVVVDENKEMVVKKMMNVNITFDHRYADAAAVQPVIKELKTVASNPEKMLKM